MIEYIKLLRNIGTFDSDSAAASLGLKRLTLIYADNARGKTTFAAVLRSLATGNPLPIVERQRLGSENPPHVVLDCSNELSSLMFQNGAWNKTLPELKIFDDVFVDENVHSGLDVDAQHRQNLHELILGDQGVALNRRLQALVSRVNEHNTALDQRAREIPQQERGGLSVDNFCALPKLQDIDDKIESADRRLMAARNQEAVRTASLFETIDLPEFDIEAIQQTLRTDLPDLDKAAEAQVQAHIQALGEGGEAWVAEGFRLGVAGDDGICPFCGQGLDGLELIAHYRAYFSEGYDQIKRDVADLVVNLDRAHAVGTQAEFELAVGTARQTGQFWTTYSDVPKIEIDTEVIARDWKAATEAVSGLLKAKQAAPLERLALNDPALKILDSYNKHRQSISDINEMLAASNEHIREVQKQVEAAKIEVVLAELTRLKATKARFSDEIAPLCADYLQEKEAKVLTEAARTKARGALEEYRAKVFPGLQDGVNNHLDQFNASFRIDSLVPTNIGGGSGSTCTYNVVINNTPIAVRSANIPQGEPSFRNSLSAGDRNTLALALFFSSLDQSLDLDKTVVVIDDPISSLDDHRSLTTIQAVRGLSERAGQAIVLSHNKRFLSDVWNGPDHKECLSLEIAQDGAKSTIRAWDVSKDAVTEHDQRHILLQEYASSQAGNKKEVAAAIRLHLEGFLRVACPDNFPPGQLLGRFLGDCRNKVGSPDEVLNADTIQELGHIVEYGNRFHHGTNPAEINATELEGFVRRTLSFVRPPAS